MVNDHSGRGGAIEYFRLLERSGNPASSGTIVFNRRARKGRREDVHNRGHLKDLNNSAEE